MCHLIRKQKVWQMLLKGGLCTILWIVLLYICSVQSPLFSSPFYNRVFTVDKMKICFGKLGFGFYDIGKKWNAWIINTSIWDASSWKISAFFILFIRCNCRNVPSYCGSHFLQWMWINRRVHVGMSDTWLQLVSRPTSKWFVTLFFCSEVYIASWLFEVKRHCCTP